MTEFASMTTSQPSNSKTQFNHRNKKNTQTNYHIIIRHNKSYSHERLNPRDSYQCHKKKLNNMSSSKSNN